MKRIVIYLVSFLLVFFLPYIGIKIGKSIGNSIDERKHKEEENKPWEKIESPYKFVEIMDATYIEVWARVENGDLYYYELYCYSDEICKKWIKTGSVPKNLRNPNTPNEGNLPFEKGKICPRSDSIPKEPPANIIECALGSYHSIVWQGRYYALLIDGTIWTWKYPVGNDGPGSDFAYVIFLGFTGLILGVLTFIIVIIVDLFSIFKKRRLPKT